MGRGACGGVEEEEGQEDLCLRVPTGLARPGRPDQVAEQLVGRQGGEGVVHHPGHELLQLVPDGGLHLLEHLLAVVVEELVHGVRQQLILTIEQVVHVDYHFSNLEVKI